MEPPNSPRYLPAIPLSAPCSPKGRGGPMAVQNIQPPQLPSPSPPPSGAASAELLNGALGVTGLCAWRSTSMLLRLCQGHSGRMGRSTGPTHATSEKLS